MSRVTLYLEKHDKLLELFNQNGKEQAENLLLDELDALWRNATQYERDEITRRVGTSESVQKLNADQTEPPLLDDDA
jgi:hypothetical protein